MTTYTVTETYTRTDIAKVFENFEADLCLIARTTGRWRVEYARDVASDVTAYAAKEYLTEIHIVLQNANGQPMCVHEYKVSTNASGWTVQQPGGNVWPSIPDSSLTVILKYSHTWTAAGALVQAQFKERLKIPWKASDIDTTYPGLIQTGTRAYGSNAYGLSRTTRERT